MRLHAHYFTIRRFDRLEISYGVLKFNHGRLLQAAPASLSISLMTRWRTGSVVAFSSSPRMAMVSMRVSGFFSASLNGIVVSTFIIVSFLLSILEKHIMCRT